MKTSLAFLYDNKSGNIQLIDKKRLVKELITNINTKENKLLNNKECDKLFNLSYKNIIQELGDKYFKKLGIGIYNTKLHDKSNVVVLINKTTKDFEKYCKKNNLKFGQEVDKIELKNDKKVVIDKVTPINIKKDIKIDNSIIEKWRKTNMNKNNLNKVIKKGAIVIAASLATMSLFGCNSKVEGNKTYTTYPIDQDEQISNGDKIVTKVEETKVHETKVEETKIEETTTAGSLNVGSIDFNTVETYNNEAEISEQLKANRNKRKKRNSYGYTKEYIKNMKIPDYLLDNTGNTESDIRFSLERRDYLWEYMEDPANFKVDYSLSDDDFISKYGKRKKIHITGLPYEFGADGYPTKEADSTKPVEIVNPNNGKTYIWNVSHSEWWDKENQPKLRYLTDEELKDIAAAYSASFK